MLIHVYWRMALLFNVFLPFKLTQNPLYSYLLYGYQAFDIVYISNSYMLAGLDNVFTYVAFRQEKTFQCRFQ